MLFSKLQTLTNVTAALCLLMLAFPAIAQENSPASKEKTVLAQEILLAELAEDESVEDVEQSEPRRVTDKVPLPVVDPAPEKPKPAPKPKK